MTLQLTETQINNITNNSLTQIIDYLPIKIAMVKQIKEHMPIISLEQYSIGFKDALSNFLEYTNEFSNTLNEHLKKYKKIIIFNETYNEQHVEILKANLLDSTTILDDVVLWADYGVIFDIINDNAYEFTDFIKPLVYEWGCENEDNVIPTCEKIIMKNIYNELNDIFTVI